MILFPDGRMEHFQEVHCPGCRKRVPFQIANASPIVYIRYQCRQCKRLLYIEGLTPIVVHDVSEYRVKPQD